MNVQKKSEMSPSLEIVGNSSDCEAENNPGVRAEGVRVTARPEADDADEASETGEAGEEGEADDVGEAEGDQGGHVYVEKKSEMSTSLEIVGGKSDIEAESYPGVIAEVVRVTARPERKPEVERISE